MSTIGEAATKRCAELADRAGVGFVDAPVLGTRQPAEEGKLVVLESGPEQARERTKPVFDAVGMRTVYAGQAGAGSKLKLVANNSGARARPAGRGGDRSPGNKSVAEIARAIAFTENVSRESTAEFPVDIKITFPYPS